MTSTGRGGAVRRAVARPAGVRGWSLRVRLAVIVCALTTVALLAANIAGLMLLRAYLVERVDRQLSAVGGGLFVDKPGKDQLLGEALKESAGRADNGFQGFIGGWSGSQTRIYLIGPDDSRQNLPYGAVGAPRLPSRTQLERHAGQGAFTVPDRDGGDAWRLWVRADRDGTRLIVAATSMDSVEATYRRMLRIDVVVTLGALAVLAVAAWATVRAGLRPLTRMEVVAGQIAGGDFARRVPDADARTEPGRLALAMNTMLDRVDSEIAARRESEQRLRRFLSDVSHELRTPLTSIRGFAELERRQRGDTGQPGDGLARIEAEAARLGRFVDDLLNLARLDEHPRLDVGPVDLLDLAAQLLPEVRVSAPDRPLTLAALDEDSRILVPAVVAGDESRLRRAIGNLLANAVRHTPDGAHIRIRVGVATPAAQVAAVSGAGCELAPDEAVAVVEVADTGPGVAAEHAPHVFDRLYRGRSGPGGGSGAGLGLAIVAAVAAAHGGRVELAAPGPAEGAVFRLLLPLAEGPAEPSPTAGLL
ncbi:ATP-binding protein [Embleya sp. NPDC056575]|uniref:sensor histidine kinase n=1 Tax=unclassified Embleya TaxID=2699296 RepID=UPI0036A92DE7